MLTGEGAHIVSPFFFIDGNRSLQKNLGTEKKGARRYTLLKAAEELAR